MRRLLSVTRLLTLTGSGGIGKTRLALHVAAGLLGNATDAVWLVDLAPLVDAALVPQAAAQAVGIREEPGRPLLSTLAAALSVGRTLLVLDNCEHLLDACAQFADALLRACPALRVLATSRDPLGVGGEVAWRVPSLVLPCTDEEMTPASLAQTEAVQLFVERARAARPDFALTVENAPAVAEVCRQLDGIPLAIELAAARVRVLAVEELVTRLGDRFRLLVGGSRTAPPRQQTLRAAIDWSYDLLSQAERCLFDRLAVFAGGFTLDAAEAVCDGAGLEASRILDLLSRLVDRSLVLVEQPDTTGPTRYRLLETLRMYGLDQLVARGEADDVRERHAAWVAEQAERAEPAFYGPEQARWLRWAEREHGNVRAALAWALESGRPDLALRIAVGLWFSWMLHGRWSEGVDWVRRILPAIGTAPTRERGLLLSGGIALASFRGDLSSNRPSGDLAMACDWIRELLAIGDGLDVPELRLAARGLTYMAREFGVALEGLPEIDLDEELEAARRIGHRWGECRALEALARRGLRAGDLDAARGRLRECVEVARSASDTFSQAISLNECGDVERAQGRHARAERLYEESLALFAELGLADQPSLLHNLGYVALATGDVRQARERFGAALSKYRRAGEQRGMAECLIGCGAVAAAESCGADAARFFGAGEAALEALGVQLWVSNWPDYERWQTRVRRVMPPVAFEQTRAEGRTLSLEQAVARALDILSATSSLAPTPVPRWPPLLTPREHEVARLAARGLTNRQIAEALVIAEKTAANHLQQAFDKLDLHSRTQLAAHAAELGLKATGVIVGPA